MAAAIAPENQPPENQPPANKMRSKRNKAGSKSRRPRGAQKGSASRLAAGRQRALGQGGGLRKKSGRIVVGLHAATEALRARAKDEILKAALQPGWEKSKRLRAFRKLCAAKGIQPKIMPLKQLSKLAESHQGLAVFLKDRAMPRQTEAAATTNRRQAATAQQRRWQTGQGGDLDSSSGSSAGSHSRRLGAGGGGFAPAGAAASGASSPGLSDFKSPEFQSPWLILDGLQDPKNLGAIIRSAWLLGAAGVSARPWRACGLSPSVLKAAAGGAEHIPIFFESLLARVNALKKQGFQIFSLSHKGESSIFEESLSGREAFVLGSEESGVRPALQKACHKSLRIPHAKGRGQGGASLNVAAAAAIALAEWQRQTGGLAAKPTDGF